MIQDTKTWSFENDRFTISTAQGFETYLFKDLIMCKGDNNMTELYILGLKAPITVSQTLKVWEDGLAPKEFWRIQKSYIINHRHILKYYHTDSTVLLMQDCIAYVNDANNGRVIAAFRANMMGKAKA